MLVRADIPASDVEALYAAIDGQLEEIGVEGRPEVALRVLELADEPESGLADFAEVVKADGTLAGRLLRMANCAQFAQRQPVTSVDRACVLLGKERLKTVALGFYLSRAAASPQGEELSRRVWGASVFRACLASALADEIVPEHTCEAFVIGLMLDGGVPLLHRLYGDRYAALVAVAGSPAALFEAEFNTLPATHVDVITALARRWKLPEVLARPIERHHICPRGRDLGAALARLERIAYCAGRVDIREDAGSPGRSFEESVEWLLRIPPADVDSIVKRAGAEYRGAVGLFQDLAARVDDVDAVADSIHRQLVRVLDETLVEALSHGSGAMPTRFRLGGYAIEIARLEPALAVAYLYDDDGRRLVAHHFRPGDDTADSILEALVVDASEDERRSLAEYIHRMAA